MTFKDEGELHRNEISTVNSYSLGDMFLPFEYTPVCSEDFITD